MRVLREQTARRAHELTQTAAQLESFLAGVGPLSDVNEVASAEGRLSAIRRVLSQSSVAPVEPPVVDWHREDTRRKLEAYLSERKRLLGELPFLENKLKGPIPYPAERFKPAPNMSSEEINYQVCIFEQARQDRYYEPIRQSIEAL